MHYLSKGLIICNVLLFTSLCAFSQNKVIGTWEAQKYTESCWAASLSNLANTWWNKKGLNQDSLYQEAGAGIDLNDFEYISETNFKFRKVIGQNILTYQGINEYLKYPYNRPLIYSYNFEVKSESYEGHFVNIVGCATSKLKYPNNYWIKIFDPKPDSLGTTYFKNYEAYQRVESNKNSLQGTFFNFIDTKFSLPKLLRDSLSNKLLDRKIGVFKDTCNTCLSDNSSLLKNLKSILLDSIFFEQLSNKAVFKTNWKIPITNIENPKNLISELSTVENVKKSFLVITYDSTFHLKGGVILKKIGKKFLIERIEDISRYKNIQSVFEKPNARLIITKSHFKFVRYTEGKTLSFADIDNLFGNNKSNKVEIYNLSEVSEKLKPHYYKITESGKKIIEACQKIVTGECCEIIENSGAYYERCLLIDLPVSEWRDTSSTIDAKSYPIRIHYKQYKGKDDTLVNRFQMGWNYQWFDSTLINNDVKKCKECYPKLLNYKGSDNEPIGKQFGGNFVYFVPIETFKKYKNSSGILYNSDIEKNYYEISIHPSDMKSIGNPRIEIQKGFLATNFPANYLNTAYPVGIICDVVLKDNSSIPCYVFNQILPNINIENPDNYKWKE
jgi:hypothetical protein